MLGFIVFRTDAELAARVRECLGRFRTLTPAGNYSVGSLEVQTFGTTSQNNYLHEEADGWSVVVSGTVMLGRQRGTTAARRIAERLGSGESPAAIYKDLRGPYAALAAHKGTGRVLILTDRDGLIPVYGTDSSQSKIYSTSQLLLASVTVRPADPVGVQEFVHGGACMNGRTLFSGIQRAPKATLISLTGSRHDLEQLWKPTIHYPYLKDTDREIVDKMHQLFSDALSTDPLDPTKAFGADLTAGTDSRTVFSFLVRSGNRVLASTAGAEDNIDVQRAREMCASAEVEHWWYPVAPTVEFDQDLIEDCVEHGDGCMGPFSLLKQLPYFEQKAARMDFLCGGNGGPLFKDHYWLFEFNRIDRRTEPNWDRIARYSLTETNVDRALFPAGIDYIEHVKRYFSDWSARLDGTNNQKLDFIYFDFKNQYFASPQFSFSNRFLDVYHPMCDARLVEYSLSIRPWIRLRARLQSELTFRNDPGIAWVLTDNYVPCVPDTGWRFPIRALRFIRYARAARRKILDFGLNKSALAPDSRALTLMASLAASELGAACERPDHMLLAGLISTARLEQLIEGAKTGRHSGYLQRVLSVEAILRRVQRLSGRPVAIASL